jgi:hypothetical protein
MIDDFFSEDRLGKAVENHWSGRSRPRTAQKDILSMLWNRSNTVGLASNTCCYCQGGGLRLIYKNTYTPCGCVFRAIFRACLNRFRECAASDGRSGTVSWEFCGGPSGRRAYSRKREEFMADFCLISRRVLDDVEYRLFRYYFLLGANWRLCSRQLKLDRGVLFHSIYRIEKKLGRAFAETEPFPIYPLDEYFGGVIRNHPIPPSEPAAAPSRNRMRIPLRRVA